MYTPSIFSNNFFDDFMNFSFPDVEKTLYGKHAAHMMSTDLKETENGYEMSIDLPGFKKDDVTAHLKDGYLIVSAEWAWIRTKRRRTASTCTENVMPAA